MGTFANPIKDGGADPWMIFKDGTYYYTQTTGKDISVWQTHSIEAIGTAERRVVWTPPQEGPMSRSIWAPELHALQGKWYIYFAADDGKNENHRMYVLESEGEDPFGPYRVKGNIGDRTNKWAIDGTVLQKEDGSLYFIWSGWEGDVNVSQKLYIARMSNPWTIEGERVEIACPEYDWETIGDPKVLEGPQVLLHEDRIHIVYSASGSWTDDYCLGLLSARKDTDVLDPASWSKWPEPVFRRTSDVFGPGHCSFARSPDGSEHWIVYHAAKHQGAGWKRNVRAQRFDWTADGRPVFGEPVSPGTPLQKPSGAMVEHR
ncbi:Extracellular exo-alpha-(1-_5)-L-arabinofuranosidase [Paenibacillus allorhizosphaerae]|uniref:Extracellular exo-alpha-(1->5)-L-arabinofuranosidase n=2 Tax=Paenibacillus allorhizosphaerae TaxID=2849866 RepID=A0ABM8VMW4_9BACL|nr:Extracellular exo-alpha-(1->5)-L-arabinofuranosidase [Paenibacillus allorhizosphaerae]